MNYNIGIMANAVIKMENLVVRRVGWKALLFYSDPTVFDRWKWLQHHLLPGPLRTLDAGCGSGTFTIYASKIGNQSIGLSFDEYYNTKARVRAQILGVNNIEFIQADLRELHLLSHRLGLFDQIICFETIEHILDDKKLIRDLSNLLKPGGKLLLSTPFKHYKYLLGDKISEVEDGGHVRWGYTHEELRDMFNECGLDVCVQEYISGYISQQLTNLMRIIGKVNKILARIIVFPLRLFQVFDRPVTKILQYPFHCVGVVGVKRSTNNKSLYSKSKEARIIWNRKNITSE